MGIVEAKKLEVELSQAIRKANQIMKKVKAEWDQHPEKKVSLIELKEKLEGAKKEMEFLEGGRGHASWEEEIYPQKFQDKK
jgi:hypothetical protein